jgi:hypothetical protein
MSARYSAAEDLEWRVSSTCDSGECVKVARSGGYVLIGNTSRPDGPIVEFTTAEWRQFLAGAKLGDFDDIA